MEEKPEYLRAGDDLDVFELYRVVRKRLGLIIGLFMVSVLAAGAVGYLMHPVYRGKIIVRVPVLPDIDIAASVASSAHDQTPVISTAETERIINELDILRMELRYDELSEKLLVPAGKLYGLVSLTSKGSKGDNYVEVTLNVKDPELIVSMKDGILNYLNGTPYVVDKIGLKREELSDMEKEIGSKMVEMEALKNAVSSRLKRDGSVLGFNPIEMEVKFLTLRKSARAIKNSNKLFKGFEIAAEPIIPKSPVKPRKAMYIAFAGAVSLFAGVVLAFILDMVEKRKGHPSLTKEGNGK